MDSRANGSSIRLVSFFSYGVIYLDSLITSILCTLLSNHGTPFQSSVGIEAESCIFVQLSGCQALSLSSERWDARFVNLSKLTSSSLMQSQMGAL